MIHNAGIMKNEKVTRTDNASIQEETVLTNLLGPMRLTEALLAHFLKQKSAVIMTVTSGLAYVPLALTPTYSATKAAVHSYTESLRYQLAGTSVEVKELVPPYVRTALMGDRQAADPNAMPLEEFISEVIKIMKETPAAPEILVGRVMAQRSAAWSGEKAYGEFHKMMNDRLLAARKAERPRLILCGEKSARSSITITTFH
ncbi:MAG: SDR family NAD(P)-dependent oxidoreductase [Proteobacteria bacterium]|nr:MAG: SDR family NAD(P)-dependent oxidoreductase [Pseudomonadota bacterium]